MFKRIIDKLMSGRYAMLMMFGSTICLMALMSIIAVLFLGKEEDKYISLVTFFGGYLVGAFSKMWDSYNYRKDRKEKKDEENIINTDVVVGDVKPKPSGGAA